MYCVCVGSGRGAGGGGGEGDGGFSHVVVSCARAQWMIIDSNHEHASVYMKHVYAAVTYYLMDIAPKDYVSRERKKEKELKKRLPISSEIIYRSLHTSIIQSSGAV